MFLWKRNMFVSIPEQQVKFWVRVRVVDVGLDPLPNCGRIDVHLASPDLQSEAHWLMILTKPIDTVSVNTACVWKMLLFVFIVLVFVMLFCVTVDTK